MHFDDYTDFELRVYQSRKFAVNEDRLREAIYTVVDTYIKSPSANLKGKSIEHKINEFVRKVELKTQVTVRAKKPFLGAGEYHENIKNPAALKSKKIGIRQKFIAAIWWYFHEHENKYYARTIDNAVFGKSLEDFNNITFDSLKSIAQQYEVSIAKLQKSVQTSPNYEENIARISASEEIRIASIINYESIDLDVEDSIHTKATTPLINNCIITMDEGDRSLRGIESFQYARRQDDFIDRDELLDQVLKDFLDFEAPFSPKRGFNWTLVFGEAGIGKSRFALEVLRRLYRQKSALSPNKYWGFVKRDRLDSSNTLSADKINTWNINGPVFLILDYAGTNRELVAVLDAMKTKAESLGQPIRLMLLERRVDSGRVSDLDRIDTEESFLRSTCYQPKILQDGNGIGIRLPSLGKKNTAKLMRERIIRERGYVHESETDEFLVQRLDDISEGERRPLFAAMVASAIADEDPSSDYNVTTGADRLKKRNNTLRYLLRRERDKFWRTTDDKEPHTALGEHENLLALATFTRGLDMTVFHTASDHIKIQIPSKENFDIRRYSRMTTTEQKSDLIGMPIGFLEPDFIGEWFVLSRLSPEARLDANVPINRPDLEVFINLGWNNGREQAAQFIRQCHQNYPDEVGRLGYLLPKIGTFIDQVISLLRDLLLDWRRVLYRFNNNFGKEGNETSFTIISDKATNIFKILQQHVNAAELLSEMACNDIADATEIYIYIRSWILSPSLRDERDQGVLSRVPTCKREGGYSPLDMSLSIQEALRTSTHNGKLESHLINSYVPRGVSFKSVSKTALGISEVYNQADLRRGTDAAEGAAYDASQHVSQLASRLLFDAATFFQIYGEQNKIFRSLMKQKSDDCSQLAHLILQFPISEPEAVAHKELASKLLGDASRLYQTSANQDVSNCANLTKKAVLYKKISEILVKNSGAGTE